MQKTLLTLWLILCPLEAQVKLDQPAYDRIKSEELEHSQAMHTLHMLTDRYGPRLTGSPNFEQAANWVVKQMSEWGFKNSHLEPWDFGHPGWLNMRAAGYMVTPIHGDLTFRVLSWTPSTKGPVTASVVEVEIPHGPPAPADETAAAGRGPAGPRFLQPTQAEFDAGIAALSGKVKGKIVMVGKAAVVPVNFEPPPLRRDGSGRGGRGGRGTPPVPDPGRMTAAQVAEAFDQFLLKEGAVVRVNDAAMDHGLIRAFQNRTYDIAKAVPTVVVRNDDYGRIERLVADGDDVKLEFDIVNETYPKGVTSYDVIGEIPGTDKADEIVMLGGHLDSWHSATGATDNAIGSTMMLEAARIIQSLGLKPRRTIRIGLWSGEEEGLLGSAAYVK
jgi:carboxypeptidase Q